TSYSFFFQAEDGIRDFHVTGVQTCALPIFRLSPRPAEGTLVEMEARPASRRRGADVCATRPRQALLVLFRLYFRGLGTGRERRRSEERRVGKEGRSWGSRWS